MRSLYDISKDFASLLDELDGQLDDPANPNPDLRERLAEIQAERAQKIKNIGCHIKNLQCLEDGIAEEVKRLRGRLDSVRRKIDGYKDFLAYFLQPGERFDDAAVSLSWRKSSAVEVPNEFAVPEQYVVTERKVNKSLISQDLKAGATLDFARLVSRDHLQVR